MGIRQMHRSRQECAAHCLKPIPVGLRWWLDFKTRGKNPVPGWHGNLNGELDVGQ
ncbi:MAG: hypothetical protein IID46_14380 [Planctomycetes bacterium]|nr:hypothetical protein [Planctomycetota bacterium]